MKMITGVFLVMTGICLGLFCCIKLYADETLSADRMQRIQEIIGRVEKDPSDLANQVGAIARMTKGSSFDALETASAYVKLMETRSTEFVQATAVAIVVDVSPSMEQPPREGGVSKLSSATDSVNKTIQQLKDYQKENSKAKLLVGVYSFSGSDTFKEKIKMQAMGQSYPAIKSLTVGDNTAIGDALLAAKLELAKTKATKQNILIITDGENMTGTAPENALRAFCMLHFVESPSVQFVAFDIEASKFERARPFLFGGIYEAGSAQQLNEVLKGITDGLLAENPGGL